MPHSSTQHKTNTAGFTTTGEGQASNVLTTASERQNENWISFFANAAGEKPKSFSKSFGFTLIELLVVIAIISLLSSVVLASLSDARQTARVTNLVRNFEEIEKAFYMWGLDEGRLDYWSDGELGISDASYPNLGIIIDETNLSEYLSTEAESSLGRPFHYVDGNGEISCSASIRGGPAASTWTVKSHDIAGAVDDIVDDGDGQSCGKVQWSEDSGPSDIDLFYKLKPL